MANNATFACQPTGKTYFGQQNQTGVTQPCYVQYLDQDGNVQGGTQVWYPGDYCVQDEFGNNSLYSPTDFANQFTITQEY